LVTIVTIVAIENAMSHPVFVEILPQNLLFTVRADAFLVVFFDPSLPSFATALPSSLIYLYVYKVFICKRKKITSDFTKTTAPEAGNAYIIFHADALCGTHV
jgi:hypothetical protein